MIDWELNRKETLRYLGYRGQQLEDSMEQQITDCGERLKKAAEAKVVYRLFNRADFPQELLQGKSILRHLQNSDTICLMAATLGSKVDQLILKSGTINVADSVIIDAWASTAIESVCNRWEKDLRDELAKQGDSLTSRFSAGYGDLPLSLQPRILQMLNAERRIGLTVTPAGIMTPVKSVTAYLGITRRRNDTKGGINCE